jgi:cellulose synthase (UDP-forming)
MAGLCVAAARYGHFLTQTPYALLMMAIAMSNAAILGATVLMAQHNLLKGIMRVVNSIYPLRTLLQKLDQIAVAKSDAFLPRLRTGAVYIAFFLFSAHAAISFGVSLWRNTTALPQDLIWARTGIGEVRVGYAATSVPIIQPTSASSPTHVLAGTAQGVQELRLKPSLGPQVSAEALQQLDIQGNMPILSWEVTPTNFGDATWQSSVKTIRERNKAVLLRPIIKAQNSASYRKAWQQLVTRFRMAGDTSAVWVWTPPRLDSVAAYFPGSAYVDWVAADYLNLTPATTAEQYKSLRLQLAQRAEINSKPILLFIPARTGQPLQAQGQRLTSIYPEIKALAFGTAATEQALPVSLSTHSPVAIQQSN